MSNISLLLGKEPFKKFVVVGGGGWWVGNTANIMFCFGPRLGLKTEVWAQAEQKQIFFKLRFKFNENILLCISFMQLRLYFF